MITKRRSTLLSIAALLAVGCGARSAEPATTSAARETSARSTSTPPGRSEGETFHALMPRAVTSFGAVTHDNRLYVLGGYDGTPHSYTPAGQSGEFWSVDLARGDDWESLPGIEGLQGLALVAHERSVCRVGGMRANDAGEVRSVDEAACFDLDRGAWRDLPALPASRSSHDAVVVGSTLYVIGGWKLEGAPRDGDFHPAMVSLDLARPDAGWTEHAVPFQRRGLGVAVAGDRIVVVGGIEPGGEVSSRVDVYDTTAQRWERGPDFPGDAFGVAVIGVGDAIYGSGRDGVVHQLSSAAWTQVGTQAFPRFFHRLVARSPRELLALGGIRGMTDAPRTAHVELVSLDRSAAPVLTSFSVPYPGRAKNRQGMFLHGDQLHVFGGNVSLEQHDFETQHFVAEHHVLDLPSLRWGRGADFPFSRQTIQTVVPPEGESGIAIGGFGHDGATGGVLARAGTERERAARTEGPGAGEPMGGSAPASAAASVARTHPEAFTYSFEQDAWSPRAALPVARSQFGLAQHGDQLWVFGGLDYDPTREGEDQFRHLTQLLVAPVAEGGAFEPVTTEMSAPRRAFGGAVLGDRYFVVGGMRGEFQLVEDCQSFDFEARTWAPIACPRRPRLNPQLVALGERLFLVGGSSAGEGGLSADRSIEVYDPSTNTWSVLLEDAGIEPKHLRAFAHRGRLLLFSTHGEDARAHVVLVDPRE